MADPPQRKGRGTRSFSLIGIELLFSFINDAGNPSRAIFDRCYHRSLRCGGRSILETTVSLSRDSDVIRRAPPIIACTMIRDESGIVSTLILARLRASRYPFNSDPRINDAGK